ncbi:peptidylprolyl isomerase [Spirosoma sp. BT702]|uniref:Peptidyl-prolyl cis-trans isomerase n=1 Tax=Spirosoma profusum TaxID=2771354 RepID=A0A926Y112_9BACT|nr:peptidylprolyl isomerase [Spirosoma profusum]MBD2701957.1 peptidylprolyl isomerase [Spirosoma profusum]
MTISKDAVAAIHYTLRDSNGTILDTSQGRDPLYYLHGAQNLIPGMEESLEGRQPGDHFQVEISPEKGYGKRDPNLTERVPRKAFGGQTVEVGMQFQANDGQIISVVGLEPEFIIVDGNHPLAGESLHFDVEVIAVRDATPDELAHGHVHGPGGAHH